MKSLKLLFAGACFTALCAFGTVSMHSHVAYAEPEPISSESEEEIVSSEEEPLISSEEILSSEAEPVVSEEPVAEPAEPKLATIVVSKCEHAEIKTSLEEGAAGDICVININPDMFYLIKSVSVNGTALVESEETSGEFSFTLVEGENLIKAEIEIDEELFGRFSKMIEQANNKDWTNLFSVQNVITILSWVLDGGLLIVIIRYFIKDKKLADKVEKGAKSALEEILPTEVKEQVLIAVENVITPIFAKTEANMLEMHNAMNTFAKCFALSQENTPESRKAILDELTGLKVGDQTTINNVKQYIEEAVNKQNEQYLAALREIRELGLKNQTIINETHSEPKKETINLNEKDDGTQI